LSTPAATSPSTLSADEPRRLRADAVRNRAKVLAAAGAAFAEHGPEAQMEDVARRAGVGVGTVYRHFPTKDALFEALLLDRIDVAVAAARDALEADDPWAGFASVMRGAAEMQEEDRGFADLLGAGVAETDAVHARMETLRALMSRVIARAQAAGELRADVGTDDVPALMCGLSRVVWSSERAAWERYLAILLDGLRNGPPTSLPR